MKKILLIICICFFSSPLFGENLKEIFDVQMSCRQAAEQLFKSKYPSQPKYLENGTIKQPYPIKHDETWGINKIHYNTKLNKCFLLLDHYSINFTNDGMLEEMRLDSQLIEDVAEGKIWTSGNLLNSLLNIPDKGMDSTEWKATVKEKMEE